MRHCRVLKNIWSYQKQTGSYVLKLTIHFSNIWIILIWIRTRNITAKKPKLVFGCIYDKSYFIFMGKTVSEQWRKSKKVYSFSSYSQRKPLLFFTYLLENIGVHAIIYVWMCIQLSHFFHTIRVILHLGMVLKLE